MAEDEVNYATVVFKATRQFPPQPQKEEEETVYDEVKVRSETTEQTGDTNDKKADNRSRHCQTLACCFGILCVFLLLGVIAACVYLTVSQESELNELKDNQTTLLAVNHNLTKLNHRLSSENENLRRDLHNLTQSHAVLENQLAKLTEENQNLTTQNEQLKTQNQELETQNDNLSEKIQEMETKWNEHSVSQAQQTIDAYCPITTNEERKCNSCEKGWLLNQSSCYVIHDARPGDRKNWDEAQANCKEKNSDLVVVANQKEKAFIKEHSWGSSGVNGYWIGLRAEGGKWKWVNGSDLTQDSWIQQPAADGQCVMSFQSEGWSAASCADKKQWICKKTALSV